MVCRSLVLVSLVAGSVAHAQPGETPPVPPTALPVPPTPSTSAAADLGSTDYDAAVEVLLAGDLGTAAARLDDIAARARDPELVTKARELARLARAMIARKIAWTPRAGTGEPRDVDADTDDKVDGRTSFVVWSTLYGLYGGLVIIDDANVDDTRAAILTVTGTTAIGLFGSYLASRDRTMTGAMADAYSLGMIEGAANVALLAHPLGLRDDQGILTGVLLGSGAVAAGGLVYGANTNITRGQVAFAGTLSMLGAASTALGIGVGNPHMSTDPWLTTVAIGTDAGLVAGLGFGHGRDLNWSVSRGRIVQLGVLLGGLAGLAAGALINGGDGHGDDTTRLICGTTLAGIWGGFGIAWRATANMRPDRAYTRPQTTTMLAPMMVPGGAGAMLTGSL